MAEPRWRRRGPAGESGVFSSLFSFRRSGRVPTEEAIYQTSTLMGISYFPIRIQFSVSGFYTCHSERSCYSPSLPGRDLAPEAILAERKEETARWTKARTFGGVGKIAVFIAAILAVVGAVVVIPAGERSSWRSFRSHRRDPIAHTGRTIGSCVRSATTTAGAVRGKASIRASAGSSVKNFLKCANRSDPTPSAARQNMTCRNIAERGPSAFAFAMVASSAGRRATRETDMVMLGNEGPSRFICAKRSRRAWRSCWSWPSRRCWHGRSFLTPEERAIEQMVDLRAALAPAARHRGR